MFLKPAIPAYAFRLYDITPQLKLSRLNQFAIQATTQNDLSYALENIQISNQKGWASAMQQLADSIQQSSKG